MRIIALVPVTCCLTAIAASMICLLAGSTSGFGDHFALYTVIKANTTRVREKYRIDRTDDSSTGPGLRHFARELEGRDFYSIHALNFCQGVYQQDSLQNTFAIKKTVEFCSAKTLGTPSIISILRQELDLASKEDLVNIKPIEVALASMAPIQRIIPALYVVSLGVTATSLAGAVASVFLRGIFFTVGNLVVGCLSSLVMGLTSSLGSILVIYTTGILNNGNAVFDISTAVGSDFIKLSWASTGAMAATTIYWALRFGIEMLL